MLFNLLTSFIEHYSFLNVFKYLTFRTGLSVITSLAVVFIIGGPLIKIFSTKNKKIPFVTNHEKNFFSKDYHREIFFYVYSDLSKKVLAQGGGYKYKKNNKVLNGFGFSCNIDNWVELI